MCLCDSPTAVLILGLGCLFTNVCMSTYDYSFVELNVKVFGFSVAILLLVLYYVVACLMSLGLIIAAMLSSRGLMEKVVLGIKIKVVLYVIVESLRIYNLSTWDIPTSKEKQKGTSLRNARMHKDSWQESLNFFPGPNLLEGPMLLAKGTTKAGKPRTTENPDEKQYRKMESEAEKEYAEKKGRKLIEAILSLFAWTLVDVFVIFRLGIFIATLEPPQK
ncbi:uncharacterized protein [Dermacentor albipictus]|uniref:uncharacterized protein isoform X2 n=1 Tax=Dermacentor albipictus TaxID=60249 RepID=UPI0031FC0B00